MKKIILLVAALLLLVSAAGCAEKTLLSKKDPVTLTMWHVYGEQADSPMNRLVAEFNSTVGAEAGIIINVTNLTNSADIGPQLKDSFADVPGALPMPDLFFCHTSNAVELGIDNLVDWNTLFEEEALANYVEAFLEEGTVDEKLVIFPVSKSTHMLFLNGTEFARFSAATGVTEADLATWEGFFAAAEQYHAWSGGKTFCAFDYMLRSVELNAIARGGSDFYSEETGWYSEANTAFADSYLQFAQALAKGHIMVSDLYSNTQVMTGEVAAGMGSSAAILYYNDLVTYPDNTTEPLDLKVLPMPCAAGGEPLATQAGVGLAARRTTEQKAEASALFASYITQEQRNLDFVASTGYMPVTKAAFESIGSYAFEKDSYAALYAALYRVQQEYTMLSEPNIPGYYDKVYRLYSGIRELQRDWAKRSAEGEDAARFAQDCLDLAYLMQ